MIIRTFGDSHSGHPWAEMKFNLMSYGIALFMNHIGAPTCASFGFEKLNMLNIKDAKYGVKDGDVVIFCFGEIDCRTHIHKHKDNYKELIERIASNYIEAIYANVSQFDNLRVMIMGVNPPTKNTKYISGPEWPILGEDQERVAYTKYLNERIKEEAKKYGYSFLDVYDKYCDSQQLLNVKMSDDTTHITNPIYMQAELFKALNI